MIFLLSQLTSLSEHYEQIDQLIMNLIDVIQKHDI
jgi:uncharacterized protein YejL (UPF0352 family)